MSGPSTSQSTAPSQSPTTSPAVSSTTVAPGLPWTPCGQVECGEIPGTGVRTYLRRAVGDADGVLVLLPDFEGPTARELAEQAMLMVGPAARTMDVVAVSPRGSRDSQPLPCGTTDLMNADPSLVAQSCISGTSQEPERMGTLATVADLERLVEALGSGSVSVVGWGRGATIAAAWVMTHPASVERAVLDSPDDPGSSPQRVAAANRAAEDTAVARVMAWCTEHISCPLVENAAKRTAFVRRDILNRRTGVETAGATEASFRLAFRQVIANGDYGAVFQALAAAENDDYRPLVAMAAAPEWAARIAGQCSDMTPQDADAIVADDARFEPAPTLFRVGLGASVARVCTQMPESPEPLGFLSPVKGAPHPAVHVFVGSGDGVTSPAMVRAMAKRNGWKFRSVRANRHLVVGHDRATTRWVSEWLGS